MKRYIGNSMVRIYSTSVDVISAVVRNSPANLSYRDVAQLVAHLLWEQGVARSNRVIPTI